MDHADLVAEINLVEKMTPAERLKHAKKRRAYQLKQYHHYEKKIEKECSKKRKHTHLNNMKRPSKRHKKGSVDFVDNVKILEAAARNDVEEGEWLSLNSIKILYFLFISFFFSFLLWFWRLCPYCLKNVYIPREA